MIEMAIAILYKSFSLLFNNISEMSTTDVIKVMK